ncbi:ester cyclase [Nocardia sp. NEAU-G5]|uniref:Ester cyclase n=1 Tax=Nocardia albiluteola TaxID=2842303 RepID=A0ABS6BAS3_9NOCA|nr:ester cyclase [Nocardia albiluteola]MBU3067402.1 ester cyclase [Nocardia albiluteola]
MSDAQEQQALNTAVFERLHDAVNSGELELISKTIAEIVRPDAILHTSLPLDVSGPAAFLRVWEILLRAYPDIHVAPEDVIHAGDKLVARQVVTGTNLGEYMGHAPTGRTVTYNEIFIFRFVDGRIAEVWGVADVFAQVRQLGLVTL